MRKFFNALGARRGLVMEISILLVIFCGFVCMLLLNFNRIQHKVEWDSVLFYFQLLVALFPVVFLMVQAVLFCFYRPVTSWPEGKLLPGCTVIVPAYNEGKAVADTLFSLLESDYPRSLLEIIAIDDGSKDDTWNWIQFAVKKSEGRIRAIRQPKNGGKKRALYTGFHEAKNEIVITIDSDSIVSKNTISNLILPFADPQVGGSAGAVRASNADESCVARMFDICFVFSCNFMRCAQSVIGAVLCSPGAISSYRKAALLPVLDTWLNQKFMGRPSNIGEDRALTSLLLRSGYRVVLQQNAQITTKVPTNYPQLCRTLLRWTRGDVREGLAMLRHFFRHFDLRDWRKTLLQYNLISQLLGLAMPLFVLPGTIVLFVRHSDNLPFILCYTLTMTWFWTLIPALLYAKAESSFKAIWAFVYVFYSVAALSWISVYSWFTVGNSQWLTREITSTSAKEIDPAVNNHAA